MVFPSSVDRLFDMKFIKYCFAEICDICLNSKPPKLRSFEMYSSKYSYRWIWRCLFWYEYFFFKNLYKYSNFWLFNPFIPRFHILNLKTVSRNWYIRVRLNKMEMQNRNIWFQLNRCLTLYENTQLVLINILKVIFSKCQTFWLTVFL